MKRKFIDRFANSMGILTDKQMAYLARHEPKLLKKRIRRLKYTLIIQITIFVIITSYLIITGTIL
jgi:hypothetical protein